MAWSGDRVAIRGQGTNLSPDVADALRDAHGLLCELDTPPQWQLQPPPAPAAVPARRFAVALTATSRADKQWPEADWVGKVLAIGEELRIVVTEADQRCVMTTLDPDTAESEPAVFETIVNAFGNQELNNVGATYQTTGPSMPLYVDPFYGPSPPGLNAGRQPATAIPHGVCAISRIWLDLTLCCVVVVPSGQATCKVSICSALPRPKCSRLSSWER